jgi:hypothetical protein
MLDTRTAVESAPEEGSLAIGCSPADEAEALLRKSIMRFRDRQLDEQASRQIEPSACGLTIDADHRE